MLATGCAGSGFHSSTFPTCIEAHQQLAAPKQDIHQDSNIQIFRIQVLNKVRTLDRHVVAAGVTALCRVVMS